MFESFIYCSVAKEHPWAEHLTSQPKRGVGALTTKERPHHVYSDSMPLKQVIGQAITDKGTTSSFEVES